jgi:hypothetical protein
MKPVALYFLVMEDIRPGEVLVATELWASCLAENILHGPEPDVAGFFAMTPHTRNSPWVNR